MDKIRFSDLFENHGFRILDMKEINGITYFHSRNVKRKVWLNARLNAIRKAQEFIDRTKRNENIIPDIITGKRHCCFEKRRIAKAYRWWLRENGFTFKCDYLIR